MTQANDTRYENQASNWNETHAFSLNASGSEISRAFDNGGGITFGLETNGSITAAAPPGAPSPVNFSAGTTSNNLASVVFSNSGGISFGLNGSTITGTVATNYQSQGAYLTTAMQSNAATISNVNLSAGTTSNNLSAFVLSNSNNFSFGLSGSTVTASYTVPAVSGHGLGVSNTGNTLGNTGTQSTGTVVFAASGAITASQSTGAGISTIWYSVAAQSNQSAIKGFGASNTGNTAGKTGSSSGIDLGIAGAKKIKVLESTAAGGPNTIWLLAPSPGAGIAAVVRNT